MKQSQSFNLKQSQKLSLTPHLQQALKILQLNAFELSNEIADLVEANPFLEITTPANEEPPALNASTPNTANNSNTKSEADHHSSTENALAEVDLNGEYASTEISGDLWNLMDDDWQVQTNKTNEVPWQNICKQNESLTELLKNQLGTLCLDEDEESCLTQLIHCLDDDGFLKDSLDDLQSYILIDGNPPSKKSLQHCINILQSLEPKGFGSTCLQDYYFSQLQSHEASKGLLEALLIVKEGFNELITKDLKKLQAVTGLNSEEIKIGIHLIQSLYTRPSHSLSIQSTQYIIPELICYLKDDFWHVKLNEEAVPDIKINSFYKKMIGNLKKEHAKTADGDYFKERLQSAQSLIKNLNSRFHTLLNVAKQITGIQQDFFHDGPQAMKPLNLQDIADNLNLHESTISRATAGKYMATPYGVLELKYFFSSRISSTVGEEHSSIAIKSIIEDIINNEPKSKPLSDDKIADILENEHQITAARRTVAKYRESLNIPSSSKRKQVF